MDIKKISQHESFGGILLILSVLLALAINNSAIGWAYEGFLSTHLAIKVGGIGLDKSLLHWINDGLMAIFFLLVGLEVKKEAIHGELSSFKKALLPILAAAGGVILPALIYVYFNQDDPTAMRGWAIPAATDIAFAIGILALLGKVNKGLRVLLLSIAIIDDIVAIAIIAVFYTADLNLVSLGISGAAFLGAIILNRMKVKQITPYGLLGIIMWIAMLKSGVHATLAGVALAMAIPATAKKKGDTPPMDKLEHDLYPWVYFGIMPLFAFANSGLNLFDFKLEDLTSTVALGITAGLVIGKQVGVFGFIWLSEMIGLSKRPANTRWVEIYGMALLTGIGFTMSLFIGTLAFDSSETLMQVRASVLVASFISAILGFIVLKLSAVPHAKADAEKASKAAKKAAKTRAKSTKKPSTKKKTATTKKKAAPKKRTTTRKKSTAKTKK